MLSRISVSSVMALLFVFAATNAAFASASSDKRDVIFGTALVALGLALLVGIAYSVKHALGLDKMAPLDPNEAGHGAAHH
jgi:hypothetical protein